MYWWQGELKKTKVEEMRDEIQKKQDLTADEVYKLQNRSIRRQFDKHLKRGIPIEVLLKQLGYAVEPNKPINAELNLQQPK
jgi:hypothetical protein